MKKLSSTQLRYVGLMSFSLFFGAGNLIFPPWVGRMSGINMLLTIFAFGITAVLLPMLAIIGIAKSDGLNKLASRVNSKFALVFTIIIYMCIGPALAMPRTASVPYEMAIAPYLINSSNSWIPQLIYTLIFFSIAFCVSTSPNKLVYRTGKYLTPSLLILISLLLVGSIIKPLGSYPVPQESYATIPMIQGFLDGYQTLDAIAALNFGLVIIMAIKSFGITEKNDILKTTYKTGTIAGIIFMIIYISLAHIGASAAALFPEATNGAQLIVMVSQHIYGPIGAYLTAAIFTLACLNTCIGLLTSCSQYFHNQWKKVPYIVWSATFAITSFILSNVGLNIILQYTYPLLVIVYPIAIVLIILALIHDRLKPSKNVYTVTISVTGIIALVNGLALFKIPVPILLPIFEKIPLYKVELGWVIPAIIAFVVSYGISIISCKKCSKV